MDERGVRWGGQGGLFQDGRMWGGGEDKRHVGARKGKGRSCLNGSVDTEESEQ